MQIGRLKQTASAVGKRRDGKENSQGNRVHTSNSRSRSKKSTITPKGMNNLLMRQNSNGEIKKRSKKFINQGLKGSSIQY
jgi:hypothetical protein